MERTYIRKVDDQRGHEMLAERRAAAEARRQTAAGRFQDGQITKSTPRNTTWATNSSNWWPRGVPM
jgi:hypothetical protein